jgi:hypothetical protein
MTRDEVNAPIDTLLNRQQVMMPTGALASRDRAPQFLCAGPASGGGPCGRYGRRPIPLCSRGARRRRCSSSAK